MKSGWEFLEVAFVMDHPDGFLDSISFWDKSNGLAYGDSFDGKPYILKTEDGGDFIQKLVFFLLFSFLQFCSLSSLENAT